MESNFDKDAENCDFGENNPLSDITGADVNKSRDLPQRNEKNKVFNHQSNFTIVNNIVIDKIMSNISPVAFKALLAIIRKTIGYQKEQDMISYSQLKKLTGIKSKKTLIKAVKELEALKLIIIMRKRDDRENGKNFPNQYRLNLDLESVTIKGVDKMAG